MLKKSIFFLIIIFLIGLGIFSFNTYTSYKENKKEEQKYSQQLKKNVHNYLVNDKNYKDKDIRKIEVTKNSKQRGLKSVEIDVVFNDDPNSTYTYIYDSGTRKIVQMAGNGQKNLETQNK
ncbi:DUF3139 domain-containing protein [Priestia megaterium]|uniref:DUF3139 domain-containing protein n=1 Tax=Priestia megaterium TaxID=1404 RepID=UPI00310117E7